jgi:hypothetical protein
MKLRYFSSGVSLIVLAIMLDASAPAIASSVYSRSIVWEIPRREFRMHVERVWEGDIVRLEFEVLESADDLSILIDRVHFYIGPRQEGGTPTRVLFDCVYGPVEFTASHSVTLTADLGGHLNILLNNTASPYPKTVVLTRVFERSTNVEYATAVLRNLGFLGAGMVLFLGNFRGHKEAERRR